MVVFMGFPFSPFTKQKKGRVFSPKKRKTRASSAWLGAPALLDSARAFSSGSWRTASLRRIRTFWGQRELASSSAG